MANQKKMRHSVNPAEELHNAGKNNYQKVDAPFVNPGISSGPLVQKSDLEDPQVSTSATAGLRSFVSGGQDANRSSQY